MRTLMVMNHMVSWKLNMTIEITFLNIDEQIYCPSFSDKQISLGENIADKNTEKYSLTEDSNVKRTHECSVPKFSTLKKSMRLIQSNIILKIIQQCIIKISLIYIKFPLSIFQPNSILFSMNVLSKISPCKNPDI